MKIGIMQPYFFPYIGYFSLIKHTDRFVLFDSVQFIRHGWIERNRVLKPNEGWQYIQVPLIKHEMKSLIKDVKINNSENWKERILSQLQHYKRKAPFYKDAIEVIKEGILINTDSITCLNKNCLKVVCDYLDIKFDVEIFSEMDLNIETPHAPDEWALNICKALPNITEYWNPPGGMEFFNRDKYEKNNLKLVFQKPILEFYPQRRGPENFEPGLSIIDVMMFNSKKNIINLLDNYELL